MKDLRHVVILKSPENGTLFAPLRDSDKNDKIV